MELVTTIKTEACARCRGADDRCTSCRGTGKRYVPEGYTQAEVEVVRNLVDAMAVQRGVA